METDQHKVFRIFVTITYLWMPLYKPPDKYDYIKPIHIITDSQTVIKWITGQYRIKTQHMKNIITYLKECSMDVELQYSPAQTGILENEIADRLAKRGTLESKYKAVTPMNRLKFDARDNWKYFSPSAVNTGIREIYTKLPPKQYINRLSNTPFLFRF